MGILNSLGHLMMDNRELHFNKSPFAPLTPEEQWLVTLSSPLSAFNGNYLDSIETGEETENLRNGVSKMWGVIDRQSFIKVFEQVSEVGQRTKFELIWQTIRKVEEIRGGVPIWMKLLNFFAPFLIPLQVNRQIDWKQLQQQTGYSRSELNTKIPNMATDNSWVPDLASALKKSFSMTIDSVDSLVAWDAVRLVSLSRWAVDLGFIDRNEFVGFAGALANDVRRNYKSWSEISAAYLVGGLIWQYSDPRMENLLRTNKMLLTKSNSPYMTVTF